MKNSYAEVITSKKLNASFKRTPLIEFRLKLVTLMFTSIILTSCSSDDGDNEDDTEEVTIVETWNLSGTTLATALDYNGDGTVSPDLFTETNCQINSTITFKSDGTGTWKISKAMFMLYDEAADTYEPICNPLDETYGLLDLEWTKTGNNRSFRYTTPNETVTETGIVSGSNLSIPSKLAILTDDGQGGTILYDKHDGTSVFDLQ